MSEKILGWLSDRDPVMELTLHSCWGMEANIITYGAIIKNLEAPDRNGMMADVILGQDTLEGYLTNPSASGALIFNLSGGKEKDILKHKMKLNTEFYTPVRNDRIPTGEIRHVRGTKLDFTSCRLLSEVLDGQFGLDHNFVLGRDYGLAGELWDDYSGRKMEVYTDCPGIQIYTGNHFDGKTRGKQGAYYEPYAGICFETQEFPNAVNVKHFPDCIVKKNTTFTTRTAYKFCVF